MECYGKSKVGRYIGMGIIHVVYEYGDDYVIKYAPLTRIMGSRVQDRIQHDRDTIEYYLDADVVRTIKLNTPGGGLVARKQLRISGQPLQIEHLNNQYTKESFLRLRDNVAKMKTEIDCVPDLIGSGGLFHGGFGNVLVDESGKIHIIDGSLMTVHRLPWYLKLAHPFVWYVKKRQMALFEKLGRVI